MPTIAIRITILSAVMAAYIGVAFRGIEYDPMEAGPSLLAYFLVIIIWTLIAVPLYKIKTRADDEVLAAFAFRCWAITATLATLGIIIFSAMDIASAGEFRDSPIIGTILMGVMVVALNYALTFVLQNLLSKRRRVR
ncbi:MAG: hypothetical protein QF483_02545 [Gammaproteobacteria bacterium]|jgi:hypothetical protein|nr:hypothetical protein [Chromatiales bacterium]MCP4924414.1 hypothetical protein [Gammaproteobacteria bacterium]MDP7154316.1 hypothetical protein [Gammaproteobacteria bacterium]MDP7295858.1 hypothetical protein [Gammaproteobacteria bacterium]MDP7418743.1 hypothetical protein [Gammaproteobacteria bacterium]